MSVFYRYRLCSFNLLRLIASHHYLVLHRELKLAVGNFQYLIIYGSNGTHFQMKFTNLELTNVYLILFNLAEGVIKLRFYLLSSYEN